MTRSSNVRCTGTRMYLSFFSAAAIIAAHMPGLLRSGAACIVHKKAMWTYDIKVFGHSDLATCAPIGSAKYCEALVSIDICTCVIHIIAIFLLPIMVAGCLRGNDFICIHINVASFVKDFQVFLSALVKAVMSKGYGCKREEDGKGQEKCYEFS